MFLFTKVEERLEGIEDMKKRDGKKSFLASAFSEENIQELLDQEEGDFFEKIVNLLKKGYNFVLWSILVHVQAYRNLRDRKIPWWAKLTYVSLMVSLLVLYNFLPIEMVVDNFLGPLDNLAIYGGITVSFNKWSDKRRRKLLPPSTTTPLKEEALDE